MTTITVSFISPLSVHITLIWFSHLIVLLPVFFILIILYVFHIYIHIIITTILSFIIIFLHIVYPASNLRPSLSFNILEGKKLLQHEKNNYKRENSSNNNMDIYVKYVKYNENKKNRQQNN